MLSAVDVVISRGVADDVYVVLLCLSSVAAHETDMQSVIMDVVRLCDCRIEERVWT